MAITQQAWFQLQHQQQNQQPQQQQKATKKVKKTVTFFPSVLVATDGSLPPTEEEKVAAWYQPSDFQQFKDDVRKTMKYYFVVNQQSKPQHNGQGVSSLPTIELDDDEDSKYCSWGIVRGNNNISFAERQRRKKQAINAVLMEETLQKDQKEMELDLLSTNSDSDSSLDYNHEKDSAGEEYFPYDFERISNVYQRYVVESVDDAYYNGLTMSQEVATYNQRSSNATAIVGATTCSSVVVSFCNLLAQEHKAMGENKRRSSLIRRPSVSRNNSSSIKSTYSATRSSALTFMSSFWKQ